MVRKLYAYLIRVLWLIYVSTQFTRYIKMKGRLQKVVWFDVTLVAIFLALKTNLLTQRASKRNSHQLVRSCCDNQYNMLFAESHLMLVEQVLSTHTINSSVSIYETDTNCFHLRMQFEPLLQQMQILYRIIHNVLIFEGYQNEFDPIILLAKCCLFVYIVQANLE